ncbi:hypothetical protein [Streptomyces luteireticuli]|uniref:hypothetical protein n=1 Tax=Streptomyces luteireticuli TaxID=173858 RepID=UPI003556C8CE
MIHVPAQHAQAIATTALSTWPLMIGLTVEYVSHVDQPPEGYTTYAVVRSKHPYAQLALLRCDGYGHVTRGCEQAVDNTVCWRPSASHLTLRDPGLCPSHLAPLKKGDWVRHPERQLYGFIVTTSPDSDVVEVDFGAEETVSVRGIQLPRVPHYIAEQLTRGPLGNAEN